MVKLGGLHEYIKWMGRTHPAFMMYLGQRSYLMLCGMAVEARVCSTFGIIAAVGTTNCRFGQTVEAFAAK